MNTVIRNLKTTEGGIDDFLMVSDRSASIKKISLKSLADVAFKDRIKAYAVSIPANDSVTINHDSMLNPRIIQAYANRLPSTPNIASSATPHDPNNYSSNEVNINDGNNNTIWYNNSQPNNLPGKGIGLDFGAPQTITSFGLVDFSSNQYYATSFDFESSNDGTNWSLELTISGHTHSPNGKQYSLPASVTARYFRVRYIAGVSNLYWVLGDLQIFDASTQTSSDEQLVNGEDYAAKVISDTETVIENLNSSPETFNVLIGA